MSRQIIKQPNGLYAQWSSVVDDFVMIDATRQDIIDDWLDDSRREITESVNKVIDALDRGDKPYHQFTMSWDEAIKESIERHGKDTEVIDMIIESGMSIPAP